MFRSPLKTVTEKIKPTQSKSGISSLKFERASDFKKFIGFIKTETKELEKIKLPKETEIKPKKKRGGILGLLGLGLLGVLGGGFGGDGDGESNERTGSEGGTASEFNTGILLSRNVRRTKDVSKIRSAKTFDKRIDKQKRKTRADRLRTLRKRRVKLKNIKDATVERKKTISKKLTKPYRFEISRQSDLLDELLGRQKGVKGLDIDPNRTSDLFDVDNFLKTGKLPRDPFSTADQLDFMNIIDELDLSETDKIVKDIEGGKGIFDKYTDKDFFDAAERVKKAQDDIEKTFYDIETLRTSQKAPNLRIQSSGAMSLFGDKGFSIKDTLDESFKFIGQKTKPLRNFFTPAAKNIAKAKVPFVPGNVSLLGVSRGLGKVFPIIDAAGAVIAFNDLGLVDFSDGILKPKVGQDNIITGLYDMFTSFYNAGVEGLGFDDANKRLFISKSRDKRLRAFDDAHNKKILEAREAKKLRDAVNMNFDTSNFNTSMLNNSSTQLPKSMPFSVQKVDGGEFNPPFDYSDIDFSSTAILYKLNK